MEEIIVLIVAMIAPPGMLLSWTPQCDAIPCV
jgi:hypothetical protein